MEFRDLRFPLFDKWIELSNSQFNIEPSATKNEFTDD